MNTDIKVSNKNLLPWSGMEDWEDGASAAPTEHTLSGAGASVAREATIIKIGTYSAKVTRGGADTKLYYDLPSYADYRGKKVTLGFWVYATVADRGRISVDDGVSTASTSSYHTGGSSWEFLEVSHDVNPSSSQLRLSCEVNDGDTIVYFDSGILCEGDKTFLTITDYMDVGKYTPANKYKGQEFRVARRIGLKIPQMNIESKTIKLDGMVVGATSTATRTSYDALTEYLNSHRLNPDGDREIKELFLYDDRMLQCFVKGHNAKFRASLRVMDVSWNFVIPDPFYRALNQTRTVQDISSGSITFTVSNSGSAFTKPIFNISADGGAITSLSIENLTTGQLFNYIGSIADTKTLVLNTDLLTVENDGISDLSNSSDELDIILVPGDNEIKIATDANGDECKIDHYDRWF